MILPIMAPAPSSSDNSISSTSVLSLLGSGGGVLPGDGASIVGEGIGLRGSGNVLLCSAKRFFRLLTLAPKFL